MATGAREFADAERQGGVDHAGDAQNTANKMAEFAEKARLVGTELVDGHKAYHVQASDINHVQNVDGQDSLCRPRISGSILNTMCRYGQGWRV
jgi:hypothetical protein